MSDWHKEHAEILRALRAAGWQPWEAYEEADRLMEGTPYTRNGTKTDRGTAPGEGGEG